MTERVIVAGSGGQGIMLLGKVLAHAAMAEGKHVTWLPAYGPEVRGGTSHCMVTLSSSEIGSPYISKADTLIILNGPSLKRFSGRVKDKGLLVLNSSLAKAVKGDRGVRLLQFPFSDIAVKLGNIKVANMVALGCYLKASQAIGVKSVLQVFRSMAPAGRTDILRINEMALQEGVRLIDG